MADIFLSYSREDEARIRGLVSQIEAQGWSVFWDRRIPAGETWRSHIGSALQDSRCIVVAWSKHSIESQWVAEEADEGKTRRVLIPLLLDHVQPPRGFREIQAADISDWHAGQTSERLNELIEDIRRLLGKQPEQSRETPHTAQPLPVERTREKAAVNRSFLGHRAVLIALGSLGAFVTVGYLGMSSRFPGSKAVLPQLPEEHPAPNLGEVTRLPTQEQQTSKPSVVLRPPTQEKPAPKPNLASRRDSWLVVAGSFGRADSAAAEQRRAELVRAGYNAVTIDSNAYPLLTPDLWVVAIGPFESRNLAEPALMHVLSTVHDAYIKNGG